MVYEYEEAMEQSYIASLVKAFKKNITDGFFNFIILDCINEKISDYEEMWSFAKTKGFKVSCSLKFRTDEEKNNFLKIFFYVNVYRCMCVKWKWIYKFV